MSAKHTECRGHLLVAVPLLLLLACRAGAVRDTDLLKNLEGRIWEKKTYEFCVGEEYDIQCGGVSDNDGNVDQRIEQITVWYNRKAKLGLSKSGLMRFCNPTETSTSNTQSCAVTSKEYLKKCQGKQGCHIIPSDHPHCDTKEFSALRLSIFCGTGKPTDSLEAGTTPSSGGSGDGSDPTSTEAPFVVEVAAQIADVKHTVQKEVEDKYVTDIEMVPCYRWSRSQTIFKKHEIFGSWKHYEFLARLTNCGHEEGCFMVKFPDGTVYDDEMVEPDSSEIVRGELEKGGDKFWVTWRGIGLKRNDYNTWGVCLPKTRSMDFAVLQWDQLREKTLTETNDELTEDQKKAVYDTTGEHVLTNHQAKAAFKRWDAQRLLDDDQKKYVYDITGEHVSTRDGAKEAFRRWDAQKLLGDGEIS